MRIFISWSKKIGLDIAIKTKRLLEKLDKNTVAFVSEVDVIGGEDVQSKIIENINMCDKLVVCFTKETKKAPWLLFEAGYARGRGKIVIPFLFDPDPNWHSWVDNPMNVAREIKFNGKDFVSEFIKTFEVEDTLKNRTIIKKYHQEIIDIKESQLLVDTECEEIVSKLMSNDAFYVENPYFKDKTAFFLTGFESFELYKIITDTFLYSGKYLWIYGRKNMKLFSGNFNVFLNYIKEKSIEENTGMDGIDFRCLFLDPSSTEVSTAHMQQSIFIPELTSSILRAKTFVGQNSELKKCFRFYSTKRDEIIIRIDNCIIYSRPVFDLNGIPQLLTNTSFEVFSVNSAKGMHCIEKYEKIWNSAKLMQ